jgi:hypothetical protein
MSGNVHKSAAGEQHVTTDDGVESRTAPEAVHQRHFLSRSFLQGRRLASGLRPRQKL